MNKLKLEVILHIYRIMEKKILISY